MSARRIFHSSVASRALAIGISSAGFGVYRLSSEQDGRQVTESSRGEVTSFSAMSRVLMRLINSQYSWTNFLEPNRTSLDFSMPEDLEQPSDRANHDDGATKVKVYDFIIVGNGNAGQCALRTLREKCPKAKIAVIDPLRPVDKTAPNRIDDYRETVTGFDPKLRTIQLLSDRQTQLKYKYGILVATGARGAPPPLELFEESALSRVFELRTTELLGNTKRPMMPPDRVRSAVVDIASSGGKIAILGSGWEALDLACLAEQVGKKKPTIVFGNPGPAWSILPQYLSSELRKKMVRRDIDIQDRSVVRYVADTKARSRKLELHSAKIYDLLETRRTLVDLLVIAPDSYGTKGTAALPTTEIPERMKESSDGRPWYKTWSQLTKSSSFEPSVVACFEDDGRIAVNAELMVASRIYAAGSVAKYPNSATGQASIAGEGSLNGAEAGRVAAINMSREYLATNATFSTRHSDEAESFSTTSLPVWRSDVTSYPGHGAPIVSSLSSLGIQALCVGHCDSERLATRGFWWTNSSAQRKITRLIEEEEEKMIGRLDKEQTLSHYRTLRRRQTRQRKRMGLVQQTYGIGVVFYLDNNGRIRGIMTWGLPFADVEGGTINSQLLKAIEHTVMTNAGVSALDAAENHQIMNTAMAMQSQKFVQIAVQNQYSDSTAQSHGLDGPVEGFATPLYRYTEVGPANTAIVKVLKRKEGGGLGVLGEDLYARDESAMEQTQLFEEKGPTPANIPVTNYPITVVPFQLEETYGSKAASLESLEELNRYMAVQRGWEENENRARPGKEDPLWLRPGDERRNYSRKQMLIDAYRRIMFPHRT